MTATTQQVKAELEKLGITVTEVNNFNALNIWMQEFARYPTTTVYPPAKGDGWVWGSSYQYGTYADADAESVAHRISETLHNHKD